MYKIGIFLHKICYIIDIQKQKHKIWQHTFAKYDWVPYSHKQLGLWYDARLWKWNIHAHIRHFQANWKFDFHDAPEFSDPLNKGVLFDFIEIAHDC